MIYISGKITGEDLDQARHKFQEAADQIRIAGGDPISPMEYIEVEEGKTWEEYMKEALYLLLMSEEIIMLPDWNKSRGAKIEHSIAKTLKYKITYQ